MLKPIFGLLALLISFQSFSAEEFLEFGDKRFNSQKLKRSNWNFEFGATYMEYPTEMLAYSGTHTNIKSESNSPLVISNFGFGREFYIGAGISSTFKINASYTKKNDEETGQASKAVEIDLAENTTKYEYYGAGASLSLNYIVENSVLNFQPFADFGLGAGVIQINKDYSFTGMSSSPSTPDPENYHMNVEDRFAYAQTSVGINFISSFGFTSYFKVSQMAIQKSESKYKGTVQIQGGALEEKENKETGLSKSFSVTTASIGFGYLF